MSVCRMDQAASVTALPTSALYIWFYPTFGATPVPLPIRRTAKKAVWVCANSLVKSEKVLGEYPLSDLEIHTDRPKPYVGAKTRYNLRVVETLVAARILARILGLNALLSSTNKKFTLREVLAAYLSSGEVKGQAEPSLTPEEVKAGLEKLLGEVERLRPVNLAGWEQGVKEVKEEIEGEQVGLTYDEMVKFSGLDKDEFYATYLSWVEGAS